MRHGSARVAESIYHSVVCSGHDVHSHCASEPRGVAERTIGGAAAEYESIRTDAVRSGTVFRAALGSVRGTTGADVDRLTVMSDGPEASIPTPEAPPRGVEA